MVKFLYIGCIDNKNNNKIVTKDVQKGVLVEKFVSICLLKVFYVTLLCEYENRKCM